LPRDEWAPRRLTVGLPLALVLGLLTLVIAQVGHWDGERVRESFAREADDAAAMLNHQLHDALTVLHATQAVFAASEAVTEDEMRRAAAPWLRQRPHLRAIGWIERETIESYREEAGSGDASGEIIRIR